MRRYAQTALLFLLGGTLLKLAFTGSYARYVGDLHLPLLILAGLGLVSVAGVTLWRDIRRLGQPGDDDATLPMQLGGLFETVVLSAPDRAGAQAAAESAGTSPTPSSVTASVPEPDRADDLGEPATGQRSTVDYRERALAAGLAAAEHEGFTEGRPEIAPSEAAPVSQLSATNAPTAVFDTVSVGDTSRVDAPDPPAPVDPFGTEAIGQARPGVAAVVAGTRGGWALLVAALAVLVVAPPSLGTDPATRLGTITAPGELPALGEEDPLPLSLVDYVAHATSGGQSLAGRRVRLVGFVLAGPRGEPYLARLSIGCCAAGARPVKVGLTGDLPGLLVPGNWIAVTGAFSELVDRDPVNGASIPYLSVVELTDLEPPTDPYEP